MTTEHKLRLVSEGWNVRIDCPCGYRSEPMHSINVDNAWRKHLEAVADD